MTLPIQKVNTLNSSTGLKLSEEELIGRIPLHKEEKTVESHLHRIDSLVTRSLEFIPLERGFFPVFTAIVQPTLNNYSRIVSSGAIPIDRPSISYYSYAWDNIVSPTLEKQPILGFLNHPHLLPDVRVKAKKTAIFEFLLKLKLDQKEILDCLENYNALSSLEQSTLENLVVRSGDLTLFQKLIYKIGAENETSIDSFIQLTALLGHFELFQFIIKGREHKINAIILSRAAESGNFETFQHAVDKSGDLWINDLVLESAAEAEDPRLYKYALKMRKSKNH